MAGRPGAGAVVGEASIKVRYAETDQMGVVYHSNYLIWFEIGRVELLRQIGFSYLELERSQYHLPVVEVRCRYKAPALYDETVIIRTRISQLRPSLIQFAYQAVRSKRRHAARRRRNYSHRGRGGKEKDTASGKVPGAAEKGDGQLLIKKSRMPIYALKRARLQPHRIDAE